jgi:hypothetical protein
MKTTLLNFLIEFWPYISVAILEIVLRLWPTTKNVSIIENVLKIIFEVLKVIPNRQKNTLKSLLILFFVSLSLFTSAQTNGSFRNIRFYNSTPNDTITNAVNGQLYFNSLTQNLRLRKNNAWISLGAGGGSLTGASNGVSLSGSNVIMGGALTQNTTVSGALNLDFTMTAHRINSGVLQIFNPARTFSYTINGSPLSSNQTVTLPNNGGTVMLAQNAAAVNSIPYQTGSVIGSYTTSSAFTFSGTTFTTPNVVSTGRGTFTSTATLSGINVGSFAGDPSAPVNGDLTYNSTTNNLRARVNGAWRNIISNTATANEINKSDGTNIVPSGLFSTTLGNLNLGSASTSGTSRTLSAISTSSNTDLRFAAQGAGSIYFDNTSMLTATTPASSQYLQFISGSDTYRFGNLSSVVTLQAGNTGGAVNSLRLLANSTTAANIDINSGNSVANTIGGSILLNPGTSGGVNGTLRIADGANRNMGVSTLVGGTVTVNNNTITANTRIFLTVQTAGGTQGFLRIAARTAGTSFTITSTSATETSTVAWLLVEPN